MIYKAWLPEERIVISINGVKITSLNISYVYKRFRRNDTINWWVRHNTLKENSISKFDWASKDEGMGLLLQAYKR